MEFGRATETDKMYMGVQDFKLPVTVQNILKGKLAEPKIYIGLPKWARDEWIRHGNLYPPKTKEKEYLDHYVQHFNSIELNATHYKIYDKESIEKWAARSMASDFIFSPKMYQGITHRGSLKGKDFLTTQFFDSIAGFGEHLGPILIQVSESYSTKRKDELYEFLSSLPTSRFEYFLEVRHSSWFEKKESFEFLIQQLTYLKIGFVITDTAMRCDALHMTLTVPKIMVRFGWMGVEAIDQYRISEWKAVLDKWFDMGLQSCYFFLHVSDEHETVGFAKWVQGVQGVLGAK
jgi:uncharacterized protein YecE (DUF72 family)